MKKALRKLKRAELVDMIYELRRDNLALEAQCDELKARIAEGKRVQQKLEEAPGSEALDEIRGMLRAVCGALHIANGEEET